MAITEMHCNNDEDVLLEEPTSNTMIKILASEEAENNATQEGEEQGAPVDTSANGRSCEERCNNKCKNDHVDEEQEDFLSVELFKRKGNFFAVAFIPLAIFGVLAVLNHFVTYLYTDSWNRNAAALALGVCTDPAEYETKTTKAVIDSHALMGITVVLAVAIQVWTGNKMHFHRPGEQGYKTPELSNLTIQAHKKVGLLVVVVWIVCAILGITFTIVSGHWDYNYDYQYSFSRIFSVVFIFGLLGIATLTNIILGAKSVVFLDRKVGGYRRNRQLFEHKGLMFFGVFWITGSALDECLMSVVQLVVHDCYIETFGMVACSAIGQTVQVSAIVLGAYRYEKSIMYDHAFVRVNIGLLIFRTSVLWASFIYLLASDYSEFTLEGTPSCFDV